MARSDERGTEILERGEILFLYRPRVEEEDPSGLQDVQQFYVVLRLDRGGKLRLLVLGRKRLPEVGAHERVWRFVDLVTDDVRAIERSWRGEERETRTRGERHQPAARPAGAGAYITSLEDGRMHLSYALGLPARPRAASASLTGGRRLGRIVLRTRAQRLLFIAGLVGLIVLALVLRIWFAG